MRHCFCCRLYNKCIQKASIIENEYAFSGSLCRIRQFETMNGMRYCITIFSLCDYKQVHFTHYEYKYLIQKLYAQLNTRSIHPAANDYENAIDVIYSPTNNKFKINLGAFNVIISPVTAFGLVMTMPFNDVNVFSDNTGLSTCHSNIDICSCRTCPLFKRLIDFEAAAIDRFGSKTDECIFS